MLLDIEVKEAAGCDGVTPRKPSRADMDFSQQVSLIPLFDTTGDGRARLRSSESITIRRRTFMVSGADPAPDQLR